MIDIGKIENELALATAAMRNEQDSVRWGQLYAVQQSLQWALDSSSAAAPVRIVLSDKVQVPTDIQAVKGHGLAPPSLLAS